MAKEETKEEEQQQPQERWGLGQVATQTQPVIIDGTAETEEESTLTIEQALVKLLNNQEKLMKLLD